MHGAVQKYLLVFLGVLAVAPAAAAQSQKKPDGEALLGQACVQCHDLTIVASQRKSAVEWRRTVNEMIWRGAPLLPGESETLARYLSAALGPDSRQKTPDRARPPAADPKTQ